MKKLFLLYFLILSVFAKAQDYKLKTTWGSKGSESGKFDSPSGVAIDKNNLVYIADRNNNRVQVFTSTGEFVRQFGSQGTETGKFIDPTMITIAKGESIYITDGTSPSYRVQKFDLNGNFVTSWNTRETAQGSQLPGSIASDKNGNIYIGDADGFIQKFDGSGKFLKEWQGSENSLKYITGLAIDSDGNVYAVDYFGESINKFDLNGKLVDRWFTGKGQITIDENNEIFYAPILSHTVLKLSVDGDTISSWQRSPKGEYIYPGGIAVSENGVVFISNGIDQIVEAYEVDLITGLTNEGKLMPEVANLFYPNPSNDGRFHIAEEAYVKITDLSGNLIFSGQCLGNEIELKNYANGIYIAEVNKNGKLTRHKLILN